MPSTPPGIFTALPPTARYGRITPDGTGGTLKAVVGYAQQNLRPKAAMLVPVVQFNDEWRYLFMDADGRTGCAVSMPVAGQIQQTAWIAKEDPEALPDDERNDGLLMLRGLRRPLCPGYLDAMAPDPVARQVVLLLLLIHPQLPMLDQTIATVETAPPDASLASSGDDGMGALVRERVAAFFRDFNAARIGGINPSVGIYPFPEAPPHELPTTY